MGTDFPLKEKSRFSGTLRLENYSGNRKVPNKKKGRLQSPRTLGQHQVKLN
jgi:hypothetical protein